MKALFEGWCEKAGLRLDASDTLAAADRESRGSWDGPNSAKTLIETCIGLLIL